MLARTVRKCSVIFIFIFLMCPSALESQNQQGHYRAMNSVGPSIANNILRDVNKPQFGLLRSDRSEQPESGFDLTSEEIKKFKFWEKGIVPFYIDVLSFSDKVLRDRIRWFLNEVNTLTSLNFIELPNPPKDNTTRWVFFINRQGQLGCADLSIKNFTNQGVQRVVLGYDCINTGSGLAETVLAIAGVPPQHNAPDRDEYIKIIEENIIPGKMYLFQKLHDTEWLFHDLHYDYHSAGHYHHHKHSANGRATMKARKGPGGISMGDQRGFSPSDIVKMQLIYNYIVKKNKNKLPACSKLFARGKNFNQIPFKNIKDIQPIPKPNKYLGITTGNSDDENNNDIIKDENIEKKSDDNGIVSAEGNGEQADSDESAEPNISESQKAGRNKTPEKSSSKMKSYKDPLSYLSDYQTGDENLQRSVWRKNRDYYNFGKVGAYFKSV